MLRIPSRILLFTIFGAWSSHIFAGNISGTIGITGNIPKPAMIDMSMDHSCMKLYGGKQVASPLVEVNPNSTLKNVFIYVKNGLANKKYPAPADPVVLNQQGCMYHPHVAGMLVGQQLEIVNDDAVLHNIHALPKNSGQFNIGQPKKGQKNFKTFDKPEIMVKIKCDVHPWMSAWIGVLDHPFFAVSDDKGNFEIKNLPAGEYDLEAWHEKFGVQTLHVKVGKANVKNADFTYTVK